MSDLILEVKNLRKEFDIESGFFRRKTGSIKAVSDVTFSIDKGETFGLVGESGCGKTTLGRCIVRGIRATSGEVIYHTGTGEKVDFLKVEKDQYRKIRQDIQMIFQDPYSSLDPRMTVYDIIGEPLKATTNYSKSKRDERIKLMAEKTGLDISYLKRYPYAFSGGQRQRIGIARALVTYPKIIVCDEAVSALDVSIQAQIINLLKDFQEEMNIAYIFIAHDLSIVEHISDRVAVMYLGQIVELASSREIFLNPQHPYTEALLSAVPIPDPETDVERIILKGEVPNAANPPEGCHFHPRCIFKDELCDIKKPVFTEIENRHYVSCHYCDKFDLKGVAVRKSKHA